MDRRRVAAERDCSRLDVFLAEALGMTRSAAKKLIDEGRVLRGGEPAKASRPVAAGEEFDVELPPPQILDLTPQDIPVDIVYEDEDVAVVNKPQGLTVHAGSGNWTGTLVNALLYRLSSLSTINGVVRPGIVHRIDKDTSGLLVVAKNDAAHLSLSAQIADKTCSRVYLALCEGLFREDAGHIETFIGRSPADRTKMAVVPAGKGRRAATNFEVVRRFPQGYTLVRFRLETGRTHQIRVHCRHVGHPIVGDPVYGTKKTEIPAGRPAAARLRTLVHASAHGRAHDVHGAAPRAFRAGAGRIGTGRRRPGLKPPPKDPREGAEKARLKRREGA